MGLSEPVRRLKLSQDPNNTKWTGDTQSFGHKMMISQGWQPGDYLGAKDAPHAKFHTEANATHIRVAIKDDNLGLGAKNGSGVGHGECTGLDAFQNLLGRLNGRDMDDIEKEQKSREDLKRAVYTEQRWGSIRFVKGGLLIGDKIQPLIEAEAERVRKLAEESDSDCSSSPESEEEVPVEKVKKSKKRKLKEIEETVSEVVAVKVKKSKKSRKLEASPAEEVAADIEEVKLSKKSKKSKDKESRKETKKVSTVEIEDTQDEERSKDRKKEKKEKKRERKERKEAKAVEEETCKEVRKKAKGEKRKATEGVESESSATSTKEGTPLAADSSGRSTPMIQGRHAVRARNIAQKRLASMDVASLNQIFMIKS